MSNRLHRSNVNVVAHAAKKTDVPHLTAHINEDFGDREPVEVDEIDPGKVRLDVKHLPRLIDVAADAARLRGDDVAGGGDGRGGLRLRRFTDLLAGPAGDRQREANNTPWTRCHVVLDTEEPGSDWGLTPV